MTQAGQVDHADATTQTYRVRFLASTDSWDHVKKIFRDDLGITKDKKDDSVMSMRDHYIVEIEMFQQELNDEFYDKVRISKCITIISDEYSSENAKKIFDLVTPVELQLRELAVYAYDLAATYKEIMKSKHPIARQLITKNKLVSEDTIDPLLSFLDFGELIDFLGRTGNQINDSNLSGDAVQLLESSGTFESFKTAFIKKFKQLTVWDIISEAVLADKASWSNVEQDLYKLKDIRNSAVHYRVILPSEVDGAKMISKRLLGRFDRKRIPVAKRITELDSVFDSWNTALRGYTSSQKAMEKLVSNVGTDALARIFERQLDSQHSLQTALKTFTKIPDIQTSAIESLLKSFNSVQHLGLSSWMTESPIDEEDISDEAKGPDGRVDEEREDDDQSAGKGKKK